MGFQSISFLSCFLSCCCFVSYVALRKGKKFSHQRDQIRSSFPSDANNTKLFRLQWTLYCEGLSSQTKQSLHFILNNQVKLNSKSWWDIIQCTKDLINILKIFYFNTFFYDEKAVHKYHRLSDKLFCAKNFSTIFFFQKQRTGKFFHAWKWKMNFFLSSSNKS